MAASEQARLTGEQVSGDGATVLLEVWVAGIAGNDLLLFDGFSDADRVDESGHEAFLCILRDITERKKIDVQLRLLSMINDLLDLSKAEVGRFSCDVRPTRLDAVIVPVMVEFQTLAEQQRLG
ncbi:MAG: hypothetical protein LJE59_06745 [Chromatiaceae bacterium]|jgi:signal transduction histidine kinase|nr:hypothetical protein [Chromatiaceae bacterium]